MINRNARQGYLEIAADENVVTYEDNEFGRHYRIKSRGNHTFLFSSPPEAELRGKLKVGKLVRMGDTPFPAILSVPTVGSVGIHTALAEDELILARDFPDYPGVLEVVTFDRVIDKDDDMPETGDGIKITLKGYVLKNQVVLQERENFKPVSGDIFPNADLITDIYQNSFGDCFLLASILSILSQPGGKDYIKGMMRQDGDYTIVRLFHPETNEPCYIRVKNSDYHRNGRSAVLHQAPWVHILEKAYTAFAFKKHNQTSYVSFPAFREMFGNGGSPEFALKILTGRQSNRITIQDPALYPWRKAELMDCLPIYFSTSAVIEELSRDELDKLDAYLKANANEQFLSELIKILANDEVMDDLPAAVAMLEALSGVNPSITQLLSRVIFESTTQPGANVLRSFSSYIDKYLLMKVGQNSPLSQFFDSVRQFSEVGQGIQTLMINDKLDEFFAAEKKIENYDDVLKYFQRVVPFEEYFPKGLFNRFREYAYEKIRWDLPFGSGRYSPESLAIYNDIEQKLQDDAPQKALVATSKTSFAEGSVPGLRNRHAYAIVGAYDSKLPDGAVVKVIRLRNPWGHTGREVDWHKKRRGENDYIRENKEKAEFEVELSEFVRYFRDYSVSEFVPPRPRREVNIPQSKKVEKPGFFKRHWGKLLIGGLLVAGLVVAGIFTFGAVPAIAAGVIAGLAVAHITVSVTVATVIGVSAIGIGAAAVGVGVGAAIGAASDKCCALEERAPRSNEDAGVRRPLLLPDDEDKEQARSPAVSQRFDTPAIKKAIEGLPEVEHVSSSPAAVVDASLECGFVEATSVVPAPRVVESLEGSNSSLTF